MLFVGDDWAEDHHDVELQDERGRVLARARLPEGIGVSLSLRTVQKVPPYSAWQLSPAPSETCSVITPPAGPASTFGIAWVNL